MQVSPTISDQFQEYSGSLLQWHPRELPKSVTISKCLILCHCKQLEFTIRLEIGKSEKCDCNQMALYCVTVTSVTVSDFSCTLIKPKSCPKSCPECHRNGRSLIVRSRKHLSERPSHRSKMWSKFGCNLLVLNASCSPFYNVTGCPEVSSIQTDARDSFRSHHSSSELPT